MEKSVNPESLTTAPIRYLIRCFFEYRRQVAIIDQMPRSSKEKEARKHRKSLETRREADLSVWNQISACSSVRGAFKTRLKKRSTNATHDAREGDSEQFVSFINIPK